MGIDYSSREAIQQAALELRKKHSALDWSANIDQLIEREGLAQGRYTPRRDKWSLERLFEQIAQVGKKVKALISLKERVILVADDISPPREAFAKGHELGHGTLSWHQEILYVCDEHDLSAATQAQLEWEANTFAGEVLLPPPLLAKVYPSFPTCMETVLQLRSWSGASIETCAVAFAKNHPRRCLLLILQEGKDNAGKDQLKLVKKVVSESASKSRLGALLRDQIFASDHVLYAHSRGSVPTMTEMYFAENPNKRYKVSVLNNGYRVLALMFDDE